jgi:hypothetical protein
VAISDADQQNLIESKADYYLNSGGQVVNLGSEYVKGGKTAFALMPPSDEEA